MDMREANASGADKYFHCKANCEAARRSGPGAGVAELLSDSREWFDQNVKGDSPQASRADQAANSYGRSRSEEHTSELQSLMRISYAVFCLKKKTTSLQ